MSQEETMEQEVATEQQQSKKQQKGGKHMGKLCVICEERRGDYVRDSKPVCSGCLNGRINVTEQFFNWTFGDLTSSITYEGFHPSPLTPPETTG